MEMVYILRSITNEVSIQGYTLLIILVILSILSLFIGVSQLSITDLFICQIIRKIFYFLVVFLEL